MEDCVHLLCESLGVHTDDEVSVENVCALYQKVFLITASLDDAQRAITQVSAQNGGVSCSGGQVLHVLLFMERERERREEMFWELQMLKSGTVSTSAGMNTQLHLLSSKQLNKQKPEQCKVTSVVDKARTLQMRLHLDGMWSVLPSMSHTDVVAKRLGWISPTSSDILLLLKYKYDIIKERLYKEMLQNEHGGAWWESLSSLEQGDCLWAVRQVAEEAFRQMDLLQMCKLPGALHCYRSTDEVELEACAESVKPRDQAWSSKPRDQAWSALVFISELESHYQEERDSLTPLLNRVARAVLTEVFLTMCVALRRAERETHSYTALLASKQHWDKWPYTRGSVSEDLSKLWLQERRDHTKRSGQEHQTSSIHQAVLQCFVLCQDQERQSLLEILHTLSLDELQGQSRDYEVSERSVGALRQRCASSLRQLKASLHRQAEGAAAAVDLPASASWAECAVHLLNQLTLAHEDEAWSLVHTFPSTDARGLLVLLQKYEGELRFPKLPILQELLQSHITSRGNASLSTPSLTDERKTEHNGGQDASSLNENQELCLGCGGVLIPEDAPYLEILEGRGHRDEENMQRCEGINREGRGEEKKGERERSCDRMKEEDDRRESGTEEMRDGGKEEISAGAENRKEAVCVEKQGSLITLAWSKPAGGVSQDQEITTGKTPADLLINAQQVHVDTACNEVKASTDLEHPVATEEHTLVQSLQDLSTITTCAQTESVVNGNITSPATSEPGPEKPHTAGETHPNKSKGHQAVCEEQKSELVCVGEVCEEQKSELVCVGEVCEEQKSELVCVGEVCEEQKSELVCVGEVCEEQKSELVCVGEVCEEQKSELVCEELQLQREATMRSLVHIQRRAERRCQQDRDRQLYRVQERLSIIQNRKSDEDLLGLTREDTFKHLANTLQQEDEQQQKTLVRAKLQQMWRERSYVLQSRRERNTAGFKELLAPTTQHTTNTEDDGVKHS